MFKLLRRQKIALGIIFLLKKFLLFLDKRDKKRVWKFIYFLEKFVRISSDNFSNNKK
jgi:hypothetical protein